MWEEETPKHLEFTSYCVYILRELTFFASDFLPERIIKDPFMQGGDKEETAHAKPMTYNLLGNRH